MLDALSIYLFLGGIQMITVTGEKFKVVFQVAADGIVDLNIYVIMIIK